MQRYKEENTIILCKKKGELTIFLALLLTIVIGFLVVLIESVRVQGIRLYIEEVFDMGLHSCLGEYEQFANIKSRDVIVNTLSPEDLLCPTCKTEMVPIGTETIRTEVILHRAWLERVNYIATTYECPKCKETEEPQFIKMNLSLTQ